MKKLLVFLIFILIASLNAELNLQHIYFSGVQPDSIRSFRIRANGDAPYLLTKNGGTITSVAMNPLDDGYDNYQVMTTNPAYPYAGFRQSSDSAEVIVPVFYNGSNFPVLGDLTPAMTDSTGDAVFTDTNLDIVNSYISTSTDKIYFAIVNNGGGFPVSSGFTFFAYMATIIDPATVNDPQPTVWGLMYTVDVAGVIAPGLYRITGTATSDLTLLGEIQTQYIAGSNCLIISCNKADLMADQDFTAWYNPDNPVLSCGMITNKITLTGGTQLADHIEGFSLIDKMISIPQQPASTPILTNAQATHPNTGFDVIFYVEYTSSEHYLPLTAQVIVNQTQVYEMSPYYFSPNYFPDFSGLVHYEYLIDEYLLGEVDVINFHFSSDNINYADEYLYVVSADDQVEDTPQLPLLKAIYPNPFRDKLHIELNKSLSGKVISIYNLKGQKVWTQQIDSQKSNAVIDFKDVINTKSSGVYLLKASSGKQSQVVKILYNK